MVAVPRESIVSVTIPAEHRPADPIKRPVLAGTVLGSSAALIDEELHTEWEHSLRREGITGILFTSSVQGAKD